jgi:hypothetical protein
MVMLMYMIVHDQGGVLGLHIWPGDSCRAYFRTGRSAKAIQPPTDCLRGFGIVAYRATVTLLVIQSFVADPPKTNKS